MGWNQPTHTSGRQQESMTIREAALTVYKLLMMEGKPRETSRALIIIKNNV
jgi:hypothetical protein